MSRARTLLRQLDAMLRRQAPPAGLFGPPIPEGHAMVDYVFECFRVEDEILARNAHIERVQPDAEWQAQRDALRDAALALQAELDAAGVPRQTFAEWRKQQRRGPDGELLRGPNGELLSAADEPEPEPAHIHKP